MAVQRGSLRYVLDPGTGALLEEESVHEGGGPGYRATYLEQGPASAAPVATAAPGPKGS